MDKPGKTAFRLTVTACALLDLLWPCAGRALLHRAPAGRWGMIWWMGFSIVLAMWTISMMINALQALCLFATIWVVVQINLQTGNLESFIRGPCETELNTFERRFAGRRISILLILLVYVVTPVVFATRAEKRITTLTVHDFGMFPNIMPGETLLVLKAGTRTARIGELVVWNSEHGTATGRIVATGGMKVAIEGGDVFVNGKPAMSTTPEPISFRDFELSAREREEAEGLEVFNEFYGDLKTPAQIFKRRGAMMAGKETEIPDGSVFILADNRSTTSTVDSRHVGPVSTANIAGQPMFVLWPGCGNFPERLDRTGSFPR